MALDKSPAALKKRALAAIGDMLQEMADLHDRMDSETTFGAGSNYAKMNTLVAEAKVAFSTWQKKIHYVIAPDQEKKFTRLVTDQGYGRLPTTSGSWRSLLVLLMDHLMALTKGVQKDPAFLLSPAIAQQQTTASSEQPRRIVIGHGRSKQWLELKNFLTENLELDYEEFNSVSVAGVTTKERLLDMKHACSFAFLVLTAEDEHGDGTMHARENVIHEVGFFQASYGFNRAISVVEETCAEFSNIAGLGQIRFPKDNIMAKSQDIRDVLEREGLL
ncbi:MAG: nucleotide-binding protein [Planctomycetes bacterium]|nr:nucleotide-binding protein [Planctomycetota bacterium]